MENGAITSKNFSIDTSGEAHFKGDGEFGGKISANSGYIGGEKGFVIEAGKLYSGLKDFPTQYPSSISTNKNVYVGINGIALGDGNFMVDSNGKMYANQGEFTGKIAANDGFIGGWIISSNSLTANKGSISISPDGIHWGDYLNINSQGATFKGHITATSGSFTGDIIANSLTLGPGSTVNGLSYNDLDDRPNIPSDLSGYITIDGKIGIIQNEDQEIPSGATGFKVSKNGLLQASNAIISGTIYASSGTFAGNVTARTMTAKRSYSIYYNDVNGNPTDSREIISATNWGLTSGDLRFGLSDECGYMISTDVGGGNTLRIMGDTLLVTAPMQIQSNCLVQSQFVIDTKTGSIPYQNMKWTPYEVNSSGNPIYLDYDNREYFSYNGYGHNHTLLPNTEGGCAIGIGNVDKQDADVTATWCIMPYNIYTEKKTDENTNGIPVITSIKRDASATMNIGSKNNKFNCLYVNAIHMGGHTYTSLNSGGGKIASYKATASQVNYNDDPKVETSVNTAGDTLTFKFSIPKGKDGTNGKDGKNGTRGPQGATGPRGPAGSVDYTSVTKIYHNSEKNRYAEVTSNGSARYFGPYEMDSKISEAVKNSIKTVSQSEDGYTLYFYTKTAPVTIDEAAFTITIPQPTGKADKVKGAVKGHLAGLDENGNLVDSGKTVADFDAAGAANTAKTEVMSYVGTIPADAKAKNVVAYIKEAVTAGQYDDSALKASVAANTAAIGTLNGTGDGSVKKAVADAVAKIVADAPEAYDTLKEISDWISTHTSDAATMNSQIKTNKEDITKLKTLIGTLPESATSKDIVSYIAEYVSKTLADSDLSQYAKAADLEAAVGRIDALEKKVPTLEAADTKNAEDITAVKGRMDTAEGKITAVEKDLATEKPKIAKNTSDITALKGLVGDGYEAIPSASIKGLFTA